MLFRDKEKIVLYTFYTSPPLSLYIFLKKMFFRTHFPHIVLQLAIIVLMLQRCYLKRLKLLALPLPTTICPVNMRFPRSLQSLLSSSLTSYYDPENRLLDVPEIVLNNFYSAIACAFVLDCTPFIWIYSLVNYCLVTFISTKNGLNHLFHIIWVVQKVFIFIYTSLKNPYISLFWLTTSEQTI